MSVSTNYSPQQLADAVQQPAVMAARLKALENRMLRIELGVNMILSHLGLIMPEVPFPPAAAVAASDPVADPAIKTGPYKYRPLATDKAEIRLLRVTTSQADSDVVDCNLIHVNLDNKFSVPPTHPDWQPLSRFKALSYTWGEPQFDESIQVDGHKFPVTKNLKEALLSLRKDPDPNIDRPYHLAAPSVWYWWIDAVCINQADIAERNFQVAVMRRIYHSAEGVQVWLGEEADDSEAAFKLAVELEKDPPRRGPGVPAPPPLVATDDERRKNWKALAAIFARPWWQRAWVRQEVALNHNIVVRCGKAACYFHHLVYVAKVMDTLKLQTGFEPDLGNQQEPAQEQQLSGVRHAHIQDLDSLRSETSHGYKYTDLAQLILLGRTCRATDLRDKVFAMLGMADPDVYGLAPDYRLQARQVLIAATKAIIFKTSKLDILGAAQNPDRHHGLPSWIPNLIDYWKARPLPQKDGWSSTMKTIAVDIAFGGADNAETLTVKGAPFSTIALLCPAVVGENDTIATLQDTYTQWRTFSQTPGFEDRRGFSYQHFMKNSILSEHNENGWLQFISIRTEKHDFVYVDDGTLLPPKQERFTKGAFKEPDDRPKTYLIPSEFHNTVPHPYNKIHAAMRKHAVGRSMGFSENGCLGLFPSDSKPGDLIASIPGAFHPLVLRKYDEGFVLVGQAFVVYESACTSSPSQDHEEFLLV